jgi:hypothetical protein
MALYCHQSTVAHISACCLRIRNCLGGYCNRRRIAFVLPEAQQPALLSICITSNLPYHRVLYNTPGLSNGTWRYHTRNPPFSSHNPNRSLLDTKSCSICLHASAYQQRNGQPPSPFKKKKGEGICNSPFTIKTIFRPNHFIREMSEGTRGPALLFFLRSYATAPRALQVFAPLGPPQKRGQGVEIRENGGHL